MRLLSAALASALALAAQADPAAAKRGPGGGSAEGLHLVAPFTAPDGSGLNLVGEAPTSLCILTGSARVAGFIPLLTWPKRYVMSDAGCTGEGYYDLKPGALAMLKGMGAVPDLLPDEPTLPLGERAAQSWGGIAGLALLLVALGKGRRAVGGAARSFRGGDKLPPHAQRMVEVMCRMALIDGNVDPSEAAAIAGTVRGLTGHPVAVEEIVAALRACGEPLRPAQIAALGRGLNAAQREMVMRGALHVALADGGTAPAEEAFVFQLAKALKLKPARVDAMMDEVAGAAGIAAAAEADGPALTRSAAAAPA